MITIFLDTEEIILLDILAKDNAVAYYKLYILIGSTYSAIKEKRPQLAKKKVLFHQDKVCVHIYTISMSKLYNLKYKLVSHSPYSPDLACSDYYLLQNLKELLGGNNFGSNSEVIEAVTGYFISWEK